MYADEVRPGKDAVDRALILQAGSVLAREVEYLRESLAAVRAWCEDRQVWAVHGSYMEGYQGARRDVLRRLNTGATGT